MGNWKNERKRNADAQAAARRTLAQMEAAFKELSALSKKTPEQKEEMRRLKKQVAHWRKKAAEKSETHSRRHKGS